MIMLSEAVSLVAHILQEAQPERVPAQAERLRLPHYEDLLLPLGQRNHLGGLDLQLAEGRQGRGKLPLAAVDHQQVRKQLGLVVQPLEPPSDHLADTGKIVNSLDTPD